MGFFFTSNCFSLRNLKTKVLDEGVLHLTLIVDVCVHVHVSADPQGGQKRERASPVLESQAVVSCSAWTLGTKLDPHKDQSVLVTAEPSLQALVLILPLTITLPLYNQFLSHFVLAIAFFTCKMETILPSLKPSPGYYDYCINNNVFNNNN